jgi:hypothetical protein
MRIIATLLLCLSLSACYRTHYANFSAANPDRAPQQAEPPRSSGGWQHFFLWGWVPSERTFDAQQTCGGTENIDSVQTRRTFLEGLVAAFAGYYINIYSPWDGAVHCKESPS